MSSEAKDFLEKAFLLRKEISHTNAYRCFTGEGEGLPGLVFDRYDGVGVVSVFENKQSYSPDFILELASYFKEFFGLRSLYLKKFVSDRSKGSVPMENESAVPFLGESTPEKITVREYKAAFNVYPYDGFSTGLFLDQRENRKFLAELPGIKEVLNLFAYTGSFSVVSALAGARTTSVDISSKALGRAKQNFVLNDRDPTSHQFYVGDAIDYLKRASKRKAFFDLVVLDPPSFSRTKQGRVFSIRKDFETLIKGSWEVLKESGHLFVSTNYEEWKRDTVQNLIKKSLPRFRWVELPDRPIDFKRQTFFPICFLLKKERTAKS